MGFAPVFKLVADTCPVPTADAVATDIGLKEEFCKGMFQGYCKLALT